MAFGVLLAAGRAISTEMANPPGVLRLFCAAGLSVVAPSAPVQLLELELVTHPTYAAPPLIELEIRCQTKTGLFPPVGGCTVVTLTSNGE